jgi:uncharacterized membrane protein
MATQKKSWLKENWKDLMLVITVAFLIFYVAVFSGVWADRDYKSNFWPNFFMVTGIVIGVGICVGWVIGFRSQRREDNESKTKKS